MEVQIGGWGGWDGRTGGRMGGWTGGQTDKRQGRRDGRMDIWTNGWKDARADRSTPGQTEAYTDRQINVQSPEWDGCWLCGPWACVLVPTHQRHTLSLAHLPSQILLPFATLPPSDPCASVYPPASV
eukprot:357763-Chlamydomonas_euryale.AAC.2